MLKLKRNQEIKLKKKKKTPTKEGGIELYGHT